MEMSKEDFRDKVNKEIGKNVIAKGNEVLEIPRIPTGSLSLDAETGGGIPVGRISSIIGEFSDGKTAMVLKIVAEFQKLWPKKTVYWIDAEGSWNEPWAKILGVDIEEVELVRPEHAQQAFNIANSAVEEDHTGLIVIDSIAAMVPKEEAEGSMDDIQVALQARLNSKFMRKVQSALYDKTQEIPPTIILINQLRVNIGGYGPPLIEPGGEALKYYPALKIRIRKGKYYPESKSVNDEGVEPKAQSIRFHIEKNKTAPPHRRGHFWFYFDTLDEFRTKGTYDRLEEAIRYALKYDIVHKRGSVYDLPDPDTGEVSSFRGSNALAAYLRSDEDARNWVERQVMERVLTGSVNANQEESMDGENAVHEKEGETSS